MMRLPAALCLLALALPSAARASEGFTSYKGHGGPIMALEVSPGGALASASFDNSIGLWSDGRPRWREGHRAAVTALDYTLAPILLSGGDDFRLLFWPPDDSPPFELALHQGKIGGIAVHPDKALVASASWDGSILLTPLPGQEDQHVTNTSERLLGHQSNVTDVAFSASGALFSTSSDGTLRIWEGPKDQRRGRVLVDQGFGINRLIVSDSWIAYGAIDGATRVVDHTGREIADFTLDRRPVLAMDYHPASAQLAIGDGHGYIMVIDTLRWRITRDFRAMRKGPVWALAFSESGAVIHAGGIDDTIYAWPVDLLDQFDPVGGGARSFLRDAESMPNGERQFMRKCSICHALTPAPSRRAGPSLYGLFGRRAGSLPGYSYSPILSGSDIIWDASSIDALFDLGPDHYIPGSKMPMQVIAGASDRADLIDFLKHATAEEHSK